MNDNVIDNKKIRKAVRTFFIQDGKVLAIKYNLGANKDYLDIPGGKIENKETFAETSIREFREETGLEIKEQEYKGKVIIEYPNRIYNMDIFVVSKVQGKTQNFEENDTVWVDLNEVRYLKRKLPSFEIIKYLNDIEISLKIIVDENHNVLEIKNIK